MLKKKNKKKVQLKDKNNITNNLILIKTTKSYPALKTILKSNSKKMSFKARFRIYKIVHVP